MYERLQGVLCALNTSLWLLNDSVSSTDASSSSGAGGLALAHSMNNVDEDSPGSLGVLIEGISFGCSPATSHNEHYSTFSV